MKLRSIRHGTIASAVNASRQLSVSSTTMAMMRRMMDTAGDTSAICIRPVVVSMSPVRRERMPPVFMSHSRDSGKWSSRWKSACRNDSITRTFRMRCR